jgi:hypothetical protein
MATKSIHGTEGPMTLGNMRANGVSSLTVQCQKCWHEVVINASPWREGWCGNPVGLIHCKPPFHTAESSGGPEATLCLTWETVN